jgi:AcrR family transcriptional regulator
MVHDAAAVEPIDGRRLRREQNREAVIDALLELFDEGVAGPSTNEVAERAGLSARSLFRYFDDVDDLYRAAIEHQLTAARPLLDLTVDPSAPTVTKIRRVVEARVKLYETIGPSARAARVSAGRSTLVAKHVHQSRAFLRQQIRDLFAPELAAGGEDRFAAIDALCAFETYDLLRIDQKRSRAQTISDLTAALTALLTS